jgi:hypothetical protein
LLTFNFSFILVVAQASAQQFARGFPMPLPGQMLPPPGMVAPRPPMGMMPPGMPGFPPRGPPGENKVIWMKVLSNFLIQIFL